MAQLFTPLQLRSVILKNRIAVSPMCQYSAEDGFANNWHLVHLGSRAVGGAGLIIVEATAVTPEGRISPNDLGLWKDEQITPLKSITEFIEQQGAVPGIQLAHAGRKASHQSPWQGAMPLTKETGAWQTIAPSAIAYKEGEPRPQEMTIQQILQTIDDFAAAAKRALLAGFKVLELHAAHGYLLHEFLSPLSNKRDDEYGGPLANRMRFVLQLTEAVRKVWPQELPLFCRISASDWTEGGWTVDDSILLSKELNHRGVDLIDCSSGGNIPHASVQVGPLYQVAFAEKIKKETGIKTGAVGLITTALEAESVLQKQQADLVFMGRQLLRDPYFPLRAAKELGVAVEWPNQYQRAKN